MYEILMGLVLIAVVIGIVQALDQWWNEREQRRSIAEERERLAPYQFCEQCETPLGDDEKFRFDSRVLCFDCAKEATKWTTSR